MADIKKIVPPADYSSQDFLTTDYNTTAEEQVIITETVNYVKVAQKLVQITENIGITEQVSKAQNYGRYPASEQIQITEDVSRLSSLVRKAATDEIAITESVLKVLARTTTKTSPTDQVTITEQVNYVLQEAPAQEMPNSTMFLSPSARRRYPKYTATQQVIEQEKPEVPLLTTKVTSSRKFVYGIEGAQIFQQAEAIRQALEKIKQQHEKQSAKTERNEMRQELVKPIVAKDEALARTDGFVADRFHITTRKTKQIEKSSSSSEQKTKVYSAIKMRYEVKDAIAYQKLIKMGKMISLIDTLEILDSIDI